MKLISMIHFVLDQGNPSNTDSQFVDKVMGYAIFLKQPLKLWMFVPCDLEGNVLEKPQEKYYNEETNGFFNAVCEYSEAKERCLFEHTYPDAVLDFVLSYCSNIESLARLEDNKLKLTQTAQNKFK